MLNIFEPNKFKEVKSESQFKTNYLSNGSMISESMTAKTK